MPVNWRILNCCNRERAVDYASIDLSGYSAFNEEYESGVTPRQKVGWSVMGVIYLGSIIFNFTDQNDESWGGYVFKMTQITAWITLTQHLLHPYSPVRGPLGRIGQRFPIGYGLWRRLGDQQYNHSEGLSNLAVTLQVLISFMFWALVQQTSELKTAKNYANAILMHGGMCLTLLSDYFINQLHYHLRSTLLNLFAFEAIYTGWNYLGQRANTVPIYPSMDWIQEPINILYAILIAAGGSLAIAGALKLLTYCRNREGEGRPHSQCCAFLGNREAIARDEGFAPK